MEGRTKIHEKAAPWTRGRRREILKTRTRCHPGNATEVLHGSHVS